MPRNKHHSRSGKGHGNGLATHEEPKEALDWKPQGQRKQRRSLHSWKRTRLNELENIRMTGNEAKRTGQNRVGWKATVVALCSTRNDEE